MNRFLPIARKAAAALAAALMLASGSASALPAADAAASAALREAGTGQPDVLLAQGGGCYAIAQGIAAQNGGTVYSADAATRGGQTVCVIVVVVPARDGERGRRLEFTVPAN